MSTIGRKSPKQFTTPESFRHLFQKELSDGQTIIDVKPEYVRGVTPFWLNGVLLSSEDYNEVDKNTIELIEQANQGDLIQADVLAAFRVADAVQAGSLEDGAFTGVGSQEEHDDPVGKSLLTRLDRLEQSFGIDSTGPAGSDVFGAVGKGAIVESGSTPDGDYVRWENGEQVCWIPDAVLTFDASFRIKYDWVFPAEFEVQPTLYCMRSGSAGSVAPPVTALIPSAFLFNANEGALEYLRVTGATDFESGDTLEVSGLACGFWKLN